MSVDVSIGAIGKIYWPAYEHQITIIVTLKGLKGHRRDGRSYRRRERFLSLRVFDRSRDAYGN